MFYTMVGSTAHVDHVPKSVLFCTKNLWCIRPSFIDKNTCHKMAQTSIISHLDYCINALLSKLSDKNTSRIQHLPNGAAQVIFALKRRVDHEPLHRSLQWLNIKKRITFTLLLYASTSLNNLAPAYISQQFTLYTPAVLYQVYKEHLPTDMEQHPYKIPHLFFVMNKCFLPKN